MWHFWCIIFWHQYVITYKFFSFFKKIKHLILSFLNICLNLSCQALGWKVFVRYACCDFDSPTDSGKVMTAGFFKKILPARWLFCAKFAVSLCHLSSAVRMFQGSVLPFDWLLLCLWLHTLLRITAAAETIELERRKHTLSLESKNVISPADACVFYLWQEGCFLFMLLPVDKMNMCKVSEMIRELFSVWKCLI